MGKRDLHEMRKANNDVEEALVPVLLRITLWMSRVLCAVPARLKHSRSGWWLAVSPTLTKLQCLIVVITHGIIVSALTVDALSERIRIGNTLLKAGMFITESFLVMLAYSIGAWAAPRQIKHTIVVLQQLKKIKSNLKGNNRLEYSKVKHVLLILYIIWQIITYYIIYPVQTYYGRVDNFSSLFLVYAFDAVAIIFFKLHWSLLLFEIYSTLKLVNDELEVLFTHGTARRYGHENEYIQQLNLGYDAICDTLTQVDKNNGPFLLFSFILLCRNLLITSYNVIVISLGTNNFKDEQERYVSIGVQVNWWLLHLCQVVVFVEPCHWIQKQRERTGRLLNKLVCHADRFGLSRMPLDPFLLQTQMHNCTLAPCGVFSITRPLLVSILGGVITYLIIIIQFQSIAETI